MPLKSDGEDSIEDTRIAPHNIIFDCDYEIDIPLETDWLGIQKQISMLFELNYPDTITDWELSLQRKVSGVKLYVIYTIQVQAPYFLQEIENSMRGIITNHGLDTTAGISGTARNSCN